ncbi:MAG: flagellar hook-length control protein FliK [Anaerolineales bacterium]
MSFPGPISISPINNANEQFFGLRAYQRITAQVISVTGTTAILEVDGHPVVAQLTSADQATTLTSQPTAQFIVTQLTDQSVTLKYIRNEEAQPALLGVIANGPELAERMLESHNIPITTANLIITRSLLKQQLPVTSELLNELQSILSSLGDWSEADADLAAGMKSAGLPVTAQSLALAAHQPVQTSDAVSQLIASLTQANGQDLPEELLNQLQSNIQTLNSLILKAGRNPSELADQLKAWVEAFGQSLENILLKKIQNPDTSISEKNLLSLIKLQNMLEQVEKQDTAQLVKELLSGLRREQFMNVKSEPVRYDDWSQVGFLIQSVSQQAQEKFSSARLRVAREPKTDSKKINPAYTRLILQVDLQTNETVEVNLSLTGKQIRTSVTAPDPEWLKQAQDELPSLIDALTETGYTLKDFQVEVGHPKIFNRIKSGTGNTNLMTVNIEV